MKFCQSKILIPVANGSTGATNVTTSCIVIVFVRIGHNPRRTLQLTTRMTAIGKIEQFKPEESITAYLERVELYFAATDISDGAKKVTVFLSVVGMQAYTLLRDLVSPAKPKEKTFEQLTEALKKHYGPSISNRDSLFCLSFWGC